MIEKLINLSTCDIRLAHKITMNHINVPAQKKQSVSLAAQLFSNSLAKAISFCGEHHNLDANNWKEV